MQKLKNTVFANLIGQVTSKELDFILHIARFQNDAGEVRGVYYRDFSDCMSVQSFYDVKNSLEKKGIIKVKKNCDIDYDIVINGNDFTDKDFSVGYINLGHAVFKNKNFSIMKVNEKLLLMDLMRITYSNKGHWQISCNSFFERYTKMFGVTVRVLRNYMHSIRQFFDIKLVKFKYLLTPKANIYKSPGAKSDNQLYGEAIVKTLCRRSKIKEYKEKELKDTANLIWQYPVRIKELAVDAVDVLAEAIQNSLQILKENCPRGKKNSLNPKLVHKQFKEILF